MLSAGTRLQCCLATFTTGEGRCSAPARHPGCLQGPSPCPSGTLRCGLPDWQQRDRHTGRTEGGADATPDAHHLRTTTVGTCYSLTPTPGSCSKRRISRSPSSCRSDVRTRGRNRGRLCQLDSSDAEGQQSGHKYLRWPERQRKTQHCRRAKCWVLTGCVRTGSRTPYKCTGESGLRIQKPPGDNVILMSTQRCSDEKHCPASLSHDVKHTSGLTGTTTMSVFR